MDAIGMIVTQINEGFLHLTAIGGIDHRVLPGQLVTVHGTKDLPGVVIQPPAHTLPEEAQSGPVPLKHLIVETGLTPRQVDSKVKIGDLVSFATEPIEMNGEYIAGHSLDNRASVAALTVCLDLLQKREHEWDVWAVATTQEEENLGGALTSGYELRPTLGVVIDVTFAKGPGTTDYRTFEMDKGPTIVWGPNAHPELFKEAENLAKRLEFSYQKEIHERSSGTDAILLQLAGEGIPTLILGVPIRYMHTPVEMVQFKDIERTGRLLAEFISSLDDAFMDKLAWEGSE
jgi:endoglucanase